MYRTFIISVLSVIIIILFTGCQSRQPELLSVSQSEEVLVAEAQENSGSLPEDKGTIFVHITGAVNNPGLYELKEGDRIYDAVMAAGGFMEEADEDYANLAELLVDGKKYEIFSKSQVKDLALQEEKVSHYTSDGLLDINLATKDEFLLLPGIGDSKAEGIMAYREEHGAFSTIEEIKNISGIGNGIFSDICAYITVR